ncbi:hypothetical protein OsI_29187 [Oryza sativa Indica Group]|uniref:hAT-like transposase RNase-H fold domain-containing protein n=1 Tax=Oryza sativa subsp. indica TaxID=39946 RepID=A2YV34_ORYSI|nr:hypothetical protein OsI_29187 [Oryza sativa Indica Group]
MGSKMKAKYDKYWEKCNMVISVACFLDPRFKTNLVNYYAEKIYVSPVASKSAFSAGERVIDPFHNRLDPEIVQSLVCTKDWIVALRKGGNVVCSIINEMDTENLERSFATLMTMATKPDYEQDGDGDIEIEYVEDEDDIVPLGV